MTYFLLSISYTIRFSFTRIAHSCSWSIGIVRNTSPLPYWKNMLHLTSVKYGSNSDSVLRNGCSSVCVCVAWGRDSSWQKPVFSKLCISSLLPQLLTVSEKWQNVFYFPESFTFSGKEVVRELLVFFFSLIQIYCIW